MHNVCLSEIVPVGVLVYTCECAYAGMFVRVTGLPGVDAQAMPCTIPGSAMDIDRSNVTSIHKVAQCGRVRVCVRASVCTR